MRTLDTQSRADGIQQRRIILTDERASQRISGCAIQDAADGSIGVPRMVPSSKAVSDRPRITGRNMSGGQSLKSRLLGLYLVPRSLSSGRSREGF